MAAEQVADRQSARPPLELVCSEVWGGNRSIDVPIELPGLRGQLYSQAASGGYGGDVHCMSVCGSGLVARMCLADVVGHGEEVAAVGDEMHDLLRRNLNALDQRRILHKLNRVLESQQLGRMTTAAMLTYFPPTRAISVSYAGHPPAWLFRKADNAWSRLTVERKQKAMFVDVPLAVDSSTIFNRRKLRVATGDRLVIVTDGVLEAPDPQNTLFGVERLEQVLAENRALPPSELTGAIIRALQAHADNPQLDHDDLTMLVIDFLEPPKTPALWQMLKNRLLRPRGNSTDPIFGEGRVLPSGS
jgi:serine phosphatase RsbU (regulator of sigma subunit)